MLKIKHITDENLDSKMISTLPYDNDTLLYDELKDEMFRYVKPRDTNQTFGNWKTKLPKFYFQHFGGSMTKHKSFSDLLEHFKKV